MIPSAMNCILTVVLIAQLRLAQGSEDDEKVVAPPYPGLHFKDPDPRSVAPMYRWKEAMKKAEQDCLQVAATGTPDTRPANCHVPGYGYQGEYYWQPGKCEGNNCVMSIYPPGCEGKDPTPTTDGLPPIGCSYICQNENEDARVEYAFYKPGTPCRHWIEFERFVTLSCIAWQNITVCRDKTPVPPGC
ncbi:uncharacterized protein LOC144137645 [Haemaphysalis longicornis]